MYAVYRNPEGKNVKTEIATSDQQPKSGSQCSEEVYKSQIEKLNGEIAMLKKKV